MIYLLKAVALSFFMLFNSIAFTNQASQFSHNLMASDCETFRDLDLVGTGHKTIASEIDRTITECGHQELQGHLLQPLCDVHVLKKRQSYIQFFVTHYNHTQELRDQLLKLKAYESALKQENKEELAQQALGRIYFTVPQWQQYNTNPYALDFAYGMHIISMCGPLVEHVVMHIGIDMLASGTSHDHHAHQHDDHGHDHVHHHHHHGCSHHHHDSTVGSDAWVYYGLQGLHWGLHLPGLYDMACDIKERATMVKYLQYQTIQIARYVESAREIYEMMTAYDGAHIHLDAFKPYKMLGHFFGKKAQCSDEMKQLFELLKSSTFQGDPSYFSHVGNVLAAYRCYTNLQEEFQLLVHAVGQLDMYLALATLIHDQTAQERWSFVQFVENGNAPRLVLQKVRNLFVAEYNAVSFSSEDALSRLVTGDNGVGKSTYLMSVGHALFMAQSFGIVPAAYCEMTPFNQIFTFRIIQDDFSAGISRFYAECARVEKIVQTASNNQGFSCMLLDEPFVHTKSAKGAQHLKQLLASLGGMEHTMTLIATHHQDVEPSWYIEHLR